MKETYWAIKIKGWKNRIPKNRMVRWSSKRNRLGILKWSMEGRRLIARDWGSYKRGSLFEECLWNRAKLKWDIACLHFCYWGSFYAHFKIIKTSIAPIKDCFWIKIFSLALIFKSVACCLRSDQIIKKEETANQ